MGLIVINFRKKCAIGYFFKSIDSTNSKSKLNIFITLFWHFFEILSSFIHPHVNPNLYDFIL